MKLFLHEGVSSLLKVEGLDVLRTALFKPTFQRLNTFISLFDLAEAD